MASTSLCFLTIAEAGRLMRAREISPVELTEALLSRIAALDHLVASYVTVTGELALDRARKAEQDFAAGRDHGPMQGIPYGLKDLFDVAGVRTSACSRMFQNHVATADSSVVRRLNEAGAVHLGKHSCQEFASAGPCFDLPWPPSRNPWDINLSPGGSSTGSGAAVAAGMAMGAMGTDVGGSIRNPASFCGLAGIKPTYGRISRQGMIANSWTLDHSGPMTWTVEDCAIMLGAIAGYDPDDPGSADEPVPDYRASLEGGIKGLRIGVLRRLYEEEYPANDEVLRCMNDAIATLRDMGAVIEDAELPPLLDFSDVRRIIGAAEFYALHEQDFSEHLDLFGEQIRNRFFQGAMIPAVDYIQAQRKRWTLIHETNKVLADYDVLLCANQFGPAGPLSGTPWRNSLGLSVTGPFNVTGHPSLCLCNGFSASGLPMSMQILGKSFDEARLFQVGHAYERATPWRANRPDLEAQLAAPAHDGAS